MKKSRNRTTVLILIAASVAFFLVELLLPSAFANAESTDGEKELSQNIEDVLEGLDLSELQQYLDENSDSYLFNFGDNAREIIEYLISGNAGTDYSGYINEILTVIFSDVVNLLPAFAEVVAIALLCAVFSA